MYTTLVTGDAPTFISIGYFPEMDRGQVRASRRQHAPIGSKRQRRKLLVLGCDVPGLFTRGRIPEPDRLILTCRGEYLPVGRIRHGEDVAVML